MKVIVYQGDKPIATHRFRDWIAALSFFDAHYEEKYHHMVIVK